MEGGGDGALAPDISEHVRLMYDITWGPVLSVFGEVRIVCQSVPKRKNRLAILILMVTKRRSLHFRT